MKDKSLFKSYLYFKDKLIFKVKMIFIFNFFFKNNSLDNTFLIYKKKIFSFLNYSKKVDLNDKHLNILLKNQINKSESDLILFEKYLKHFKFIDKNHKSIYFKKIYEFINQNDENLYKLYNMIETFTNYLYDVDLNNLKRKNYFDLKSGDIVLSKKSKTEIKKTFEYKLTKYLTKSNIVHANIFLNSEKKNSENNYIFLDVEDIPENVSRIKKFFKGIIFKKVQSTYTNDNVGIILRVKFGLSKSEKNKIVEYCNSMIGVEYGLIKALNLILLSKIFFPLFKKKYRNYDSKTIFCSEFVSKAYENAKIYITNKEDNSTVTPIDILNSPELQIIGYLDNNSKK